jgi:hypothetical protein
MHAKLCQLFYVVKSVERGIGLGGGTAVEVSEILVSGSGSSHIQKGVTVETETVHWKRLGQALPECDNRHQ